MTSKPRLSTSNSTTMTRALDSDFHHFTASMRLPIAPVWGSSGLGGGPEESGAMEGVREILAGWVMRYLPPLQSVLLSFHLVPTFLHPSSNFPATASPFASASKHSRDPALLLMSPGPEDEDEDEEVEGQVKKIQFKGIPLIAGSGFGLAQIEWKGFGWRPRVGQRLSGSPTLSTPSHISLLLHNLFNASIPASHIPTDLYYFDPEYPVPASIQLRQQQSWPVAVPEIADKVEVGENDEAQKEEGDENEEEVKDEEEEAEVVEEEMHIDDEDDMYREKGWWRHKATKLPLGGEAGEIHFTVVGLTIANNMISITGSLLADPFSFSITSTSTFASHPITTAAPTSTKNKRRRANSDSDTDNDSDADSLSSVENYRGAAAVVPTLRAPPRLSSASTVAAPSVKEDEKEEMDSKAMRKAEAKALKKAKKEVIQAHKKATGQTPVREKDYRLASKKEKKEEKKEKKKKQKVV